MGTLGYKHSKESKEKISKSTRGIPKSFNHKKKISLSMVKGGESYWEGTTNKREYHRRYQKRTRLAAVEALGSKCVRCGFTDKRALQIDHIHGGGSKERKERGFSVNFHRHVLLSFLKGEGKYQLLCANCNWIKRFENNEARGRIDSEIKKE